MVLEAHQELYVNSLTQLEMLSQKAALWCYGDLSVCTFSLTLLLYDCLVQITSPDYSQLPERRALTQPLVMMCSDTTSFFI